MQFPRPAHSRRSDHICCCDPIQAPGGAYLTCHPWKPIQRAWRWRLVTAVSAHLAQQAAAGCTMHRWLSGLRRAQQHISHSMQQQAARPKSDPQNPFECTKKMLFMQSKFALSTAYCMHSRACERWKGRGMSSKLRARTAGEAARSTRQRDTSQSLQPAGSWKPKAGHVPTGAGRTRPPGSPGSASAAPAGAAGRTPAAALAHTVGPSARANASSHDPQVDGKEVLQKVSHMCSGTGGTWGGGPP